MTGIIKSEIVTPATDIFWEQSEPFLPGMEPKNIVIIVAAYAKGGTEELQLKKMIDACGLKTEQFNLIELNAGEQMAWHRIRERLNPKVIFLIGVLPAQLGISALFSINNPNRFDGCTWLPALALAELEKHEGMRRELWVNGMKPIFKDSING